MYTMNCLYPYNTSLLFHHTLVLHNHSKSHTLIFYLILQLKVVNRQAFIRVYHTFFRFFFFFHFYCQQIFCKQLCSMIIGFWHQIVSSYFFHKFNISMSSHIFHSFSKNCIIHQFKKIFLRIIFSFIFLDLYSYQYLVLAKHFD